MRRQIKGTQYSYVIFYMEVFKIYYRKPHHRNHAFLLFGAEFWAPSGHIINFHWICVCRRMHVININPQRIIYGKIYISTSASIVMAWFVYRVFIFVLMFFILVSCIYNSVPTKYWYFSSLIWQHNVITIVNLNLAFCKALPNVALFPQLQYSLMLCSLS